MLAQAGNVGTHLDEVRPADVPSSDITAQHTWLEMASLAPERVQQTANQHSRGTPGAAWVTVFRSRLKAT